MVSVESRDLGSIGLIALVLCSDGTVLTGIEKHSTNRKKQYSELRHANYNTRLCLNLTACSTDYIKSFRPVNTLTT